MKTIELREVQMKRVSHELIEMFALINSIKNFLSSGLFAVIVSSLFSTGLIVYRVSASSSIMYGFLVWNLFLAWLPYLVARKFSSEENYRKKFFLGMLWLLFFPNAPYIITDFVHLRTHGNSFFWLDLSLLFSSALTGLMLGLASLARIHEFLKEKFSFFGSWGIICGIIFLSAFGIYLGRELRFNSWDVVAAPLELGTTIFSLLLQLPADAASFTIIFTTLIFFCYLAYLILRKKIFFEQDGRFAPGSAQKDLKTANGNKNFSFNLRRIQ